ncbi:ABC transporter permease [Campylobacter sp. MIT 12-8780]|uniref:ABC transporter permease n=1 Tax=unclassified Campylobacter TaxID=2593542 RepID=UPI00115F3B82|nr:MULTISPECIES: ABC transporter permease [unclassified Campylobacter]NDJ27754.1 ABC transporter permease [Campylobacter sp. MIT 19-121]TQR41040.1 ABC transporter permease [Campylobacter sp. MIT 12-8780]
MRKILILSPFLFCLLFALFVPLLSPYDANLVDLSQARQYPSFKHFFGTDLLGRDLFVRCAYALRVSFFVGFIASFLALTIALVYAFVSRLFLHTFFLGVIDALLALPSLIIVMFVQSFLGANLFVMACIIALAHFAYIVKLLDNEIDKVQKTDFYLSAIVLGSTRLKALLRQVLPASLNIILVIFILNIAHAIGNEASLSFFGLGVNLGEASLGILLSEGAKAIFIGAWWLVVFPLFFLLLLILPLLALANFLQDSLGVKI